MREVEEIKEEIVRSFVDEFWKGLRKLEDDAEKVFLKGEKCLVSSPDVYNDFARTKALLWVLGIPAEVVNNLMEILILEVDKGGYTLEFSQLEEFADSVLELRNYILDKQKGNKHLDNIIQKLKRELYSQKIEDIVRPIGITILPDEYKPKRKRRPSP